jgi:5'-deoxynucleotidase YfbR-like HD superfamily hydrolase
MAIYACSAGVDMTQDEIIEMAIQARLAFDSEEYPDIWQTYMNVGKQEIEAFAKLVAAKEREACAKVCDEFNFGQSPIMIQRAIRARGEA